MIPSVRKVLVVGGGSAGFLAAISVKTIVPDVEVELVRSPEIGIIGVGEATTPYIPTILHGYLKFDVAEFYRIANPQWKNGIRFLWGPRKEFNYPFRFQCNTRHSRLTHSSGYFCRDDFSHAVVQSSLMTLGRCFLRREDGLPLIDRDAAYHLENVTFVAFLETQARRLGVIVRDDTVTSVKEGDAGIESLHFASGAVGRADLFVDCSGFRSLLLGQTLKEPYLPYTSSLFCDRAIVGGWDRADEPILPFTVAETMNAGWCWRIDHEHRIHRGYVHSSSFMSEEEATREFLAKNPKVKSTHVVKFKSGRYRNIWVKNVLAIGNSNGFVEPLESSGLTCIAFEVKTLAETLRATPTRRVTDSQIEGVNNSMGRAWDAIRDFLAVHYRFNRRLDTPFWRACLADTNLAGGQRIVDWYRENGPLVPPHDMLTERFDFFKLEGYWTLLIGQMVPYETPIVIDDREWRIWHEIRAANERTAANAVTAEEALAVIRRPEWEWDNNFYALPTSMISGTL